MSLTDKQKTYLIFGVGAAGLAWWWWRRRQGLSLIPNNPFSGGGGFAGSGPGGGAAVAPGVGGTLPIDDADIIKARDAQTGALARHSCIFPNRWINTTTGPYYGHCVAPDVFPQWTALPGNVQGFATEATYAQFMRSIGR
jgi:hypothetical protein